MKKSERKAIEKAIKKLRKSIRKEAQENNRFFERLRELREMDWEGVKWDEPACCGDLQKGGE